MAVPTIPRRPNYVTLRGESLSAIDKEHDLDKWAKSGYRVAHVVVIRPATYVVRGLNPAEVEVLLEHSNVRSIR